MLIPIILFWIGILLLGSAVIGVLFSSKLKKENPGIFLLPLSFFVAAATAQYLGL